jgi:hypothetical protein
MSEDMKEISIMVSPFSMSGVRVSVNDTTSQLYRGDITGGTK